jgi:hypothetical protein
VSEEKFSKCGGEEKKCKCKISGVQKKKWRLKGKFREKKNQSAFG